MGNGELPNDNVLSQKPGFLSQYLRHFLDKLSIFHFGKAIVKYRIRFRIAILDLAPIICSQNLLTFAYNSCQVYYPLGTSIERKKAALSSGKEVLINIPLPNSKPATKETRGTIATYQ